MQLKHQPKKLLKKELIKLTLNLEQVFVLTLNVPRISKSCIEIKIKLNFYFHTSLCCLKRFYEGIKGLHKNFWGTAMKCENKNLTQFFLFVRDWDRKGLGLKSDQDYFVYEKIPILMEFFAQFLQCKWFILFHITEAAAHRCFSK